MNPHGIWADLDAGSIWRVEQGLVLGKSKNFGIRARSARAAGFVGGAYVYIDPTPSKNVFKVNIDVIPRNMGTIPAHGVNASLAHAGAMG